MDLDFYRDRRKALDISYDAIVEIAKNAGLNISRRTVAGFFAGEPKYSNLSIKKLRAIDYALGLEQPTPNERKAGVKDSSAVRITALEDEILELFRELGAKRGEAAQQAVINLLETILN